MLLFPYKLIISTKIFKFLLFLPSYNPFNIFMREKSKDKNSMLFH